MHVISTWFFEEDDWSGQYAQVRGDSRTEVFRDVYRKCLVVFFSTARRCNPTARLILYLNRPWRTSASQVAENVWQRLSELKVETRVIDYDHEPPETFTRRWKNQFFVLDILRDLKNERSEGAFVLLDSDVVWSSRQGARDFWDRANQSVCVMPIAEARNVETNGQSPETLAKILGRANPVEYFGGELVAGPFELLPRLVRTAEEAFRALMSHHQTDNGLVFEEAHVLSAAYQLMQVNLLPEKIAKRMWTQPLKFKNVLPWDEETAIWHVPAEKKYGIRRMYSVFLSSDSEYLIALGEQEWKEMLSGHLGIPKNSPSKWISDVSFAVASRVRDFVFRAREKAGNT
jgi:hypothetical protein